MKPRGYELRSCRGQFGLYLRIFEIEVSCYADTSTYLYLLRSTELRTKSGVLLPFLPWYAIAHFLSIDISTT